MAVSGTSGRGKGFSDAIGASGLNEEVRSALTAAFEALCDWRSDAANMADRHGSKVFDKMSIAAKAIGWPPELVDITRQQIQQASKMQLQIIDRMMDLWEQQVKSPGTTFPSASGSLGQGFFPGLPNFGMGGLTDMASMANMDFSNMQNAPLQFWMHAADMWQKSWQQALSSWMEAQSGIMESGNKKPPSK
ncbi:MAG: hypothetical protein ACKOW3_01275 [Hyphomicrobium sp.]